MPSPALLYEVYEVSTAQDLESLLNARASVMDFEVELLTTVGPKMIVVLRRSR